MGNKKRQPGQDDTKPETRRLLTAAEYFLQHRNFADCCKYAARARDSDPTHPAPTRILAIASVLSASKVSSAQYDYYTVLNLPQFDSDAARIGSSFKTLASILDPKSNPCPLSSEAFDLALKSWSVLSNPVEKAKFDDELRRKMAGGCMSGGGGGTFWTMCPYCYYVYEYDRVFEDCSIRCANERCRRVLHAAAIGAPPPPDVVEEGRYWCAGFMPLEFSCSNGEGMREKLWNPFAPANGSVTGGKGCDHNVASNGDCVVVLDDDETVEGNGFEGHCNGEKVKIEGEDSNSGDKNDAINGEKVESAGGNTIVEGVKEVRMKRKKSVPWNSKKLMGRGFRIDSDQARFIRGVAEEGHSNVDENEGEVSEHWFGGEILNDDESVVEFFEGDDDVFVSLPCDFDLGNGEI